MNPTPWNARFRAFALALATLTAACADRDHPLAPVQPSGAPIEAARLACRVDVAAGRVRCGTPAGAGDARTLILGSQGVDVLLASIGSSSWADTFAIDVTVRNLIGQALGTADGSQGTAEGVRVFFTTPPLVTSGSGSVDVANPDGTGIFTAAAQPYFQYSGGDLGWDGMLEPYETSAARTWKFRLDSTVTNFSFLVYVSADVQHPNGWIDVLPGYSRVGIGGSTTLEARVFTRLGRPDSTGAPVSWASSNPSVATVDAWGVVTGVSDGLATITASTTSSRVGSATVRVRACLSLDVGDVHVADMPLGAELCLPGDTAAEYLMVPVNVSMDSAVELNVLATDTGGPSLARIPARGASPSRGTLARGTRERFEQRMRALERRDLTPRIGGARRALAARRPGGARRSITPGAPLVGDLMELNVETGDACDTPDLRTGRVEVVGTRVIVVADTTNPSDGLQSWDYQQVADQFDTLVWPTVTASFGEPEDVDANGRVVVFYTRALNEDGLTTGFSFRRDLFVSATCATSNEGELVYMPAADPSGTVSGDAPSVMQVKDASAAVLGHELQHVVNASRRLYVNFAPGLEEAWLDEGLSHAAEELLFYAASGRSPRQDLEMNDVVGATWVPFEAYALSNHRRFRQWLASPGSSGALLDDGDEAARGAAWAFLRYAADRVGGTESAFWSALSNSTGSGLANLQAAVGADPRAWLRDFAVASYADGAGLGVGARYTHPSWDFRVLYDALDTDGDTVADGWPLVPHDLFIDQYDWIGLSQGGGAAFLRLEVPTFATVVFKDTRDYLLPRPYVRFAVIRIQ